MIGILSMLSFEGRADDPKADEDRLVTKGYRFTHVNNPDDPTGATFNPNIVVHGAPPLKERLKKAGLTFPEGASVTNRGLPYPGMLMRNTELNHRKLEELMDELLEGKWALTDKTGANKAE